MLGAGLEPARGFPQGILSPPRLPFRHPGREMSWAGIVTHGNGGGYCWDSGIVVGFAVGIGDAYQDVDAEVFFAGAAAVNRARPADRVELFPMIVGADENEVSAVQDGATRILSSGLFWHFRYFGQGLPHAN